jgi:DNA-binding XRE family transcriptional regulator
METPRCSGEALEGILRLKEKSETNSTRLITNLDLFANGKFNIFSSSKVMWDVSNILTRKQDLPWKDDTDGKRIYTSKAKDGIGELNFWVTDNPEAQCPKTLAGEAATTVIQNFDIRAVCMHLIYAAHVTSLDKPWEEEFVIDDRQIASYLGLDKRKDLKKQDKLKLIEHLALQPALILIDLFWSVQGKEETFYIERSKVWEISIAHYGQRDAFDQTKGMGLTIKGRAGLWAKFFLNRQGQAEGRAFYQYGVLSKKLLQGIIKNWQHSEGAVRMLPWLAFKNRVGRGQWLTVGTLMELAYGLDKVAAAHSDPELRTKIADTWDKDLLILNDEGWRIEFDPLTYLPQIQPCWKEEARELNKRPRGFWNQLRTSRLIVHLPKEIEEGLVELERKTPSKSRSKLPLSQPKMQPQPLTEREIKAAREAKGWSQERLAQEMGKSKMWISLIERGKRNIKTQDQEQLRVVLDLASKFT